MHKKYFIKFANFIKNYGSGCAEHDKQVNRIAREDMARMVISIQDNPNFDKQRFLIACGLK